MSHKIKIQKSPNNETRITLYPVRRKSQSLREIAADLLGCPAEAVVETGSTSERVPSGVPLLDIRSEFRTKCVGHSYNRTEFGKNAKTRLMRAGGAMDKIDPCPWHYLFITATLPSNDEWAKWAIAEDSAWICDTLKSWLSKRMKNRHEFYVWEMQERGALHFHWCIWMPDKNIQDNVIVEFRLQWMRLLDGIEKRTGVNMWGRFSHLSATARYCVVQLKVETIEKSVAAYMAGYCGTKKDKHAIDKFIPYFPRRWFGISRPLSSAIETQTETIEFEYSSYRESLVNFEDLSNYFHEDSVKSAEWCHTVGTGKTSVHYHSPETQVKLWQARKMLSNQPSLSQQQKFFAQQWANLSLTYSEYLRELPALPGLSFLMPRVYLMDSLLRQSAQSGHLSELMIQDVEALYSDLQSNSSSHHLRQRLLKLARQFCRIHSQNYSLMRYDNWGWLLESDKFNCELDNPHSPQYARTSGTESRTPIGATVNLVPPKGHPEKCPNSQTSSIQLPLL